MKIGILYKVGENAREKFSRLELVNRSGQEKGISKFFEKHLEKIFRKLELLVFEKNGEKTTKWNYSKEGQFDAICWYLKERTFIIFEYKSTEYYYGHKEQIERYLNELTSSKISQEKLVKLLGKKWENIDISWEKLKLVFIAPNSPIHKKPENDKIIWVESEWYGNGDEVAVTLKSKDDKFFSEITEIKLMSGEISKNNIKNQKLNEKWFKLAKENENAWKEKWLAELDRINNEISKEKLSSKKGGKMFNCQYENWFCCICGEGSPKKKFRIAHPYNNCWAFFNLMNKTMIEFPKLTQNMVLKIDVNKPPICKQCHSEWKD